jgi:hypothetical protein
MGCISTSTLELNMKFKMCTIVFVVIALIIAVLSLLSNPNAQMYAAYATHFFVSIIPVLGTAALLKYITCCKEKTCCCNKDNATCNNTKGSCQ